MHFLWLIPSFVILFSGQSTTVINYIGKPGTSQTANTANGSNGTSTTYTGSLGLLLN